MTTHLMYPYYVPIMIRHYVVSSVATGDGSFSGVPFFNFNAGETQQMITLDANTDSIIEGDEVDIYGIFPSDDYTIGTTNQVTITYMDATSKSAVMFNIIPCGLAPR